MIENYLLEELVAFAQTGTLAQTAARLHVTQPTVTRGMQKLEADLGVTLFDRQPNRITLTPTGQLAAQQAQRVLTLNADLVTTVQNFDHNHRSLQLSATLPGPLLVARQLPAHFPRLSLNTPLMATAQISPTLTTYAATLVLSDQELQTETIESVYLGDERLAVHLNRFMYQANQATITFQDLTGLKFLVLQDIGHWRDVIQAEIPNAQFMYQAQRDAFTAITTYSDFPYFSTNLSVFDSAALPTADDNRVCLPISDPQATMPIYANYLIAEKKRVAPILAALRRTWPEQTK